MIHSLSGKIFIRDNQKIPKNSYLIFIYGSHRLVYKSENVKYLTGDSAFTLEGSPIFNSVLISLETWELRINDVPINNVRWFFVLEEGDKYKIKDADFSTPIKPKHWVLSFLSLGLLGFPLLYKKNQNLASRLAEAQRELCNSLSARKAEFLQDTKEETNAAQFLKDEFGSLKGARVALLKLKQDLLDAWGGDANYINEEEAKWITKIRNTFSSFESLFETLNYYKEIDKNLKLLSKEEIEDAVNIKNTYGSIYLAQKELEKFFTNKEELDIILFFKQTYGNLQRVHDELLRYQRDLIDLRTFKHSKSSLDNKDAEWVIKIKDRYDSFESLFRTIDKYKELKQLVKGLSKDDVEEAINIKKKLDASHTSKVTIEKIIEDKHELDALVLLKHEYGSITKVKEELIEVAEDPEYLAEIYNIHESLEDVLGHLENFEKEKGYSEGDLTEVVKMREKYASIAIARKELEDYQQLKDSYGSLETLMEILKEYRNLQTKLTSEEIKATIQLKQDFGSFQKAEQEIKKLKQLEIHYGSLSQITKVLDDHKGELNNQELQEAIELKEKYSTFKNIKKELEDFKILKDKYGNNEYIIYKLENSEDPEHTKRLEESNKLISERNQVLTAQLQQKIKDEQDYKPIIDALKGDLDENVKLLISLQSKYGSLKEIEKKLEDISDSNKQSSF